METGPGICFGLNQPACAQTTLGHGSGVSTRHEPFLVSSIDVLPSLELTSLVLRM